MRTDKGYIIEFITMGNSVKVSAVDTHSGTEVSIIGPATASQKELTDVVVKKLEFMLKKKNQGA